MARRASSSGSPFWLVTAIVVILAAAAGGYALFGSSSDPYRTVSTFPVQDYLDNANSLRGNVYKVDGTIAKSLQWSPNAGRLFSVDLSGSGNDVVPILIPPQFKDINFERGHRFFFKIEVSDKGVLRVQDVKKA